MGYLVSAHISKKEIPCSALESLPDSVTWSLYKINGLDAWAVDTYRTGKQKPFPFSSSMPMRDIANTLDLDDLEKVKELFRKAGFAHSFNPCYINSAILLSRASSSEILAIYTDDDVMDFSCTADSGEIRRIACLAGGILFIWESGKFFFEFFNPEFEEDTDSHTDIEPFRNTFPTAKIIERENKFPIELHCQTSKEVQRFLGVTESVLGLGSFDVSWKKWTWDSLPRRIKTCPKNATVPSLKRKRLG